MLPTQQVFLRFTKMEVCTDTGITTQMQRAFPTQQHRALYTAMALPITLSFTHHLRLGKIRLEFPILETQG